MATQLIVLNQLASDWEVSTVVYGLGIMVWPSQILSGYQTIDPILEVKFDWGIIDRLVD